MPISRLRWNIPTRSYTTSPHMWWVSEGLSEAASIGRCPAPSSQSSSTTSTQWRGAGEGYPKMMRSAVVTL
eukprot:9696807-Alexandrium_andersonii.AAC.1